MSERPAPYRTGRRGGDHTISHNAVVGTIREYLRVRGAWELKILGGLGQRAGVPDLLAVLRGRAIAIEVKTGSAVLSAAQHQERRDLLAAGALYVLAHAPEDVEDALLAAGLVEARAIMRYGP